MKPVLQVISIVEAVEKPRCGILGRFSEKNDRLTRVRINYLHVPKVQVTARSLRSGTVNTFSTVSFAGSNIKSRAPSKD